MKFTQHPPHKRTTRGKPLSLERKYELNRLFFEEGKTIDIIKVNCKVSRAVLERELFHTLNEWDEFKQRRR